MPVNVGTLLVDVRFNTGDLGRRLAGELGAAGANAGRAADAGISAGLSRIGASLGNTGRQLTLGLTLPLVAFGKRASDAFLGFDRAMTQVSALVGVNQNTVNAWRGDVLELGAAYGVSAKDAAEALYFITSSGIKAADAMGVLQIAVQGQAIGLGSAQQVADITTSAINAYGKENITAAKAADVLTVAVREGKGEADKMGGALSAVIPIASSLNIGFGEVAGAMSAMTLSGTTPDEAATQLRGILNTLQDMPPIAQRALKSYTGLDYATVRQNLASKGLIPTLQQITESFKGNEVAVAEVFGNVRALTGVNNLFGAKTNQTIAIVNKATAANGDFNESLEKTRQSVSFRYTQAMAEINQAMTSIGAAVLPVIADLTSGMADLLNGFSKLPQGVQQTAVTFGAFIAAVGPLVYVGGSIAKLAGGVGLLTARLSAAAYAGGTFSSVLISIGPIASAAFGAILPLLGPIIVALATATATITLFQKAIHFADGDFANLAAQAKEKNLNVKTWDELQGRIQRANEGMAQTQKQIDELHDSPLSFTPGGVQELQLLQDQGQVFQEMGTDAQRLADVAGGLSNRYKQNLDDTTRWVVEQGRLGNTFKTSEEAAVAYEASLRSLGTAAAGTGGFPALMAKVKDTSDAFFGVVNAEKAYSDALQNIVEANEKVTDAEKGVTDALRQRDSAAKRITDADRRLAESGRKLADARTAAADAQQALNDALSGPSVDEKIDVESAKIALAEARANARESGQTTLERRRSRLDILRAQEALKQAQGAHDERVTDARKAVATTTQAVVDAEDAQRDAADAIIEARRGLADAEDKVAEARRGVDKAVQDVATAEANAVNPALNLASAQATLGTMFQTNTAEGVKFMDFLKGLKDLYPELGAQIDVLRGKYALLDTSRPPEGNMPAGMQSERAIEGRATGGPTYPGHAYQVNETGVPELYAQGGKQYLIPLATGQVTPITDIPVKGGDGFNVGDINVYETAGPRQTAYEVRRELRKESFLSGRRP